MQSSIKKLRLQAINHKQPETISLVSVSYTHLDVYKRQILTSAKSGIFAGAILGIGRAFGEATAVAMVAGNKMYGPTLNLFDTTRTLTTTMLAGLNETTGLDYDIRFSTGLVLMAVILLSNLLLNYVKKKVGKVQ